MRLYERGVSRVKRSWNDICRYKYEFGISNGKIMLMDEVNTPDSSRGWMKDDYEEDLKKVKNHVSLTRNTSENLALSKVYWNGKFLSLQMKFELKHQQDIWKKLVIPRENPCN